MSTVFLVKFLGLFSGVVARTVLPWLRKVKEGKVRGFSRRYVYSALASLALGLILALTIFPEFEAGIVGEGFEAYARLFCLAFGFGFGWNALVNEGGAWAVKPASAAGPPGEGKPKSAA